MVPISIDKFTASYIKSNQKESAREVKARLKAAVAAKRNGSCCHQCGQPIWAVGSAIAG
jgi:hypothetical protein